MSYLYLTDEERQTLRDARHRDKRLCGRLNGHFAVLGEVYRLDNKDQEPTVALLLKRLDQKKDHTKVESWRTFCWLVDLPKHQSIRYRVAMYINKLRGKGGPDEEES